MLAFDLPFINEEFRTERVSPQQLDLLWAAAWRHFGQQFFRYNLGFYEFDIRRVIPLRIRLSDFSLTKSQRRVLRRNADLETDLRPVSINAESERLFDRHKARFRSDIPESIYDFISPGGDPLPSETLELTVRREGRLVAASYFDSGERAVSGIYAMFEPTEASRSLGIFTLLKEIEFAIEQNKDLYYLGYSYEGSSFYDYKKRFRATEAFDWRGGWTDFKEDAAEAAEPGFGPGLHTAGF